jgi:catechol 2,3-dioxygenase-like lactoylglutathione lyase family enzyme
MTTRVGWSTPLLHVAEIERSIRFYETLGFTTVDTDGAKPLGWARLHCEGGALMLALAEDAIVSSVQGVLFYMYTPDLAALRERLVNAGLKMSEIRHPPYMPSGEVAMKDPDGYVVLICHWGKTEQEQWERRLAQRK